VMICYLFIPPAGAHPANPNLPINVNYVFGFNDQQPQHWVNQNLYVILYFSVLWLVAFLPTHLVLRKVFAASVPAASRRLPIRFF
jgi:branched-subunit amino acid permease